MAKFFIIIQALGDFILPIAGVFAGLCAISKKMGQLVKDWESAVKKSVWKRRLFGFALTLFCLMYLVAIIHTRWSESEEKSTIYQNQMVLKEHVKNFAADLADFSKDYIPNSPGSEQSIRYYVDKMNDFRNQLAAENDRSSNLENLFDKSWKMRTREEQIAGWTNIAEEFSRMADKLPTNQETH